MLSGQRSHLHRTCTNSDWRKGRLAGHGHRRRQAPSTVSSLLPFPQLEDMNGSPMKPQ